MKTARPGLSGVAGVVDASAGEMRDRVRVRVRHAIRRPVRAFIRVMASCITARRIRVIRDIVIRDIVIRATAPGISTTGIASNGRLPCCRACRTDDFSTPAHGVRRRRSRSPGARAPVCVVLPVTLARGAGAGAVPRRAGREPGGSIFAVPFHAVLSSRGRLTKRRDRPRPRAPQGRAQRNAGRNPAAAGGCAAPDRARASGARFQEPLTAPPSACPQIDRAQHNGLHGHAAYCAASATPADICVASNRPRRQDSASAIWMRRTPSWPSRSAMVRATRKTR